jgi:hypothetical protein
LHVGLEACVVGSGSARALVLLQQAHVGFTNHTHIGLLLLLPIVLLPLLLLLCDSHNVPCRSARARAAGRAEGGVQLRPRSRMRRCVAGWL